jgi:hypothetical protein
MGNGSRPLIGKVRDAPASGRARTRRPLNADPILPGALVNLVLATGDPGNLRPSRWRAGVGPKARSRPPVPRRLPSAITVEMPPNIVYRRYPLVTSLLIELDELRRAGIVSPSRRGR